MRTGPLGAALSVLSKARLGLVLMIGLPGCQHQSDAPRATAPSATEPTPVAVVKPARNTVRRGIVQPGQIEAFQQTPVFVKIAGYVKVIHKDKLTLKDIDIGTRVRQGEVLAELSVPEMDEELKQKAALVEQFKAEADLAEKAFEAAKASFETAKAMVDVEIAGRQRADALIKFRQSVHDRYTTVAAPNIDQQTVAEALHQLEAAKASRAEVEAKVKAAEATREESAAKRDKAGAEVNAAKARHKVALANHAQMATLLEYAKVVAPYDGVVTQRKVDIGHFVQPASGGKGEALFVVSQMDPVRIFLDVPETDAGFVKDGDPARIRVPALQGQELTGRVTRNAWALDYSTAKVARTLRTEIDVENTDGRLRPGMYANVTLTVKRENVLSLPLSAVVKEGDQSFCFRVENGKAVRTQIQVGLSGGELIEVQRLQAKSAKEGEAEWKEFTGAEEIVAKAAGVTDGQSVSTK